MKKNWKILSNDLDQAPKIWERYENELNNPSVHNQIIAAFDKNKKTLSSTNNMNESNEETEINKMVALSLEYYSKYLWYQYAFSTLNKISTIPHNDENKMVEKYPEYFVKTSTGENLKITIVRNFGNDIFIVENKNWEIECIRELNSQNFEDGNIHGTIIVKTSGKGIAWAVETFTNKYLSYKHAGRKWVITDHNIRELKNIRKIYKKNPSKILKKILELKEVEHKRWLSMYGENGKLGFSKKEEEYEKKILDDTDNNSYFDSLQKNELVNNKQQIDTILKKIEDSIAVLENGRYVRLFSKVINTLDNDTQTMIKSYFNNNE